MLKKYRTLKDSVECCFCNNETIMYTGYRRSWFDYAYQQCKTDAYIKGNKSPQQMQNPVKWYVRFTIRFDVTTLHIKSHFEHNRSWGLNEIEQNKKTMETEQ